MLKVTANSDTGKVTVEAEGSFMDICGDSICIIQGILDSIKSEMGEMGEKMATIGMISYLMDAMEGNGFQSQKILDDEDDKQVSIDSQMMELLKRYSGELQD